MLEIEFTRKGLKLYNAVRILLSGRRIYVIAKE